MQLSISRQRSAPSKCLICPNERSLPWSMVLNNLTRVERFVHEIFDILERGEQTLLRLARAFSQLDFNKMKARLHYLAPIFCNLTQVPSGRELCCHARYHLLEKLLPFASYVENVVRRGGTIGIQKNVCFDSVYHNGILGEDGNTLVAILQPLCGPEEFSDEDSEMLPIEFQMSLPSCTAKKRLSLVLLVTARSKRAETDPDVRKMLLECLFQLCSTRRGREILWEARVGIDRDYQLACENVVDILIKLVSFVTLSVLLQKRGRNWSG